MKFAAYALLFVASTVYCLPVENSDSVSLEVQPQSDTNRLVTLLRNRRSPVPDPHHRSKIHAHVHIHGHYDEPSYIVKPVPVVQPVVVKPVPVVAQPVPVVAQPVSTGCNVCGGGGYGGGFGGSQSQASSQASSFSAGVNSPFGGAGFSSAQSSAQAGSSGIYGK